MDTVAVETDVLSRMQEWTESRSPFRKAEACYLLHDWYVTLTDYSDLECGVYKQVGCGKTALKAFESALLTEKRYC